MIEPAVEEADEEVIQDGEDPRGPDGVVCADVGHDGDFGGERHVRGEEDPEEAGDGATLGPFVEGVEDHFVAAVRISG